MGPALVIDKGALQPSEIKSQLYLAVRLSANQLVHCSHLFRSESAICVVATSFSESNLLPVLRLRSYVNFSKKLTSIMLIGLIANAVMFAIGGN